MSSPVHRGWPVCLAFNKKHDSVNLPYLTGDTKSVHTNGSSGARGRQSGPSRREWKLIRLNGKPDELYDLASDLGESNLAAEKPEVATRLATRSILGA
jgi:hypothetical protein